MDLIGNHSGFPVRLVRSSLVWALTAVAVATSVCFLAFYFYAIFFIRFMIVPALALGLFHSGWLYLERRTFADASEAVVFAVVSGGLAGLLGFPPIFANVTDVVFGWRDVAVVIAASVIGGAIAGRMCVGFVLPLTTARRTPHKRFARGALLLVPLFVFEIVVYGPALRLKLPVSIVLKDDVMGLRAGNARGSSWSGGWSEAGPVLGSGASLTRSVGPPGWWRRRARRREDRWWSPHPRWSLHHPPRAR